MVLETESALRDIAFFKAIFERGRLSTAKGAWLLIVVGSLFFSASLFHWAFQNGFLALPRYSIAIAWGAAAAVTVLFSLMLNAKTPHGTTADFVYRATRWSVIIVSVLLWGVVSVASWRFRDPDIMELAGPVIYALNGGFWLILLAVTERKSLRWVPIVSFAAPLALAFLFRTKHFYLANAVACFCLLVVPGIMMKLSSRREGGGRRGLMPDFGFDIEKIDELVHGRVRLGIMALLASAEVADFNTMRDELRTTDGNLSVHLRKLEDGGYIKLEKTFVQRRPLTRARLTKAGKAALARYLESMAQLVLLAK
ncbi:MAG: transcriptional regulator [Alphaproteobacteria bacterium]